VRVQRRGAVRTHDPQVLEPVVGRLAVDVVEDQRHAAATPQLALAAHLARALLEPGAVQAQLEVVPVVVRASDQDLLEGNGATDGAQHIALHRVGVEVVGRHAQTSGQKLQGAVVASRRPHAETPQRVAVGQ